MENGLFFVEFDKVTGGISQIVIKADGDKMNWVKPGKPFGFCSYVHNVDFYGESRDFKLQSFSECESGAVAEYYLQDQPESELSVEKLRVITEYSFDDAGRLQVKTRIKNEAKWQKFFLEGDIAVNMNFYDDYYDAHTCMTSRCSAHLWCGKNSSWVCALKMGESEHNLGLSFTEGGAASYSQVGVKHSDRGYFLFNLDLKTLRPYEEYAFSYVIFPHSGKSDFLNKLASLPQSVVIESDNWTYFKGEQIRLSVRGTGCKNLSVSCGLPMISSKILDDCAEFVFSAEELGESVVEFNYGANGDLKTFAKIFVSEEIKTLLNSRLNFMADRQQYNEKDSYLDGAFLPYDTQSGSVYYDEVFSDHNAQRERLGMTIMLADYLRYNENEKLKKSFDKALKFVLFNVFDEKSGEVFNSARKVSTWLRLYNFPWVALLFIETFRLLGDKKYLQYASAVMDAYYERGGKSFYPNGIFVRDIITELEKEEMTEQAERLKTNFLEHVEQIIRRGTNYPKHEVNYEQTIVTPAVSFILDAYLLTGDERYLTAVQPHISVLERFDGLQPHYMLNGIAIRFWDDYWFGKIHVYGDTLPHYWSALSSIDYIKYANASGDEKRLKRGVCGLKNCLCLFNADGSASCARIFPFKVNGVDGERFDPLCNDQDFALYFAYDYLCVEKGV